jgi:hypothetical protein
MKQLTLFLIVGALAFSLGAATRTIAAATSRPLPSAPSLPPGWTVPYTSTPRATFVHILHDSVHHNTCYFAEVHDQISCVADH